MATERKVKVHVRLLTVVMPDRLRDDEEIAHDIIEVVIGPKEHVEQVDVVRAGAHYTKATTDAPSAAEEFITGRTGSTVASRLTREVNVRNRDLADFRVRVISVEYADTDGEGEIREQLELDQGEIVEDAEIVRPDDEPNAGWPPQ